MRCRLTRRRQIRTKQYVTRILSHQYIGMYLKTYLSENKQNLRTRNTDLAAEGLMAALNGSSLLATVGPCSRDTTVKLDQLC